MLHYKHEQHRHGPSQTFFHWSAKSTFCLPISGCWRYNANGRSHNAFYTTKEILRQQCQKYTSLAARFLFTLYKSDFLLSAVIVSLPLLATDAFKSHMRLNAYYRHLKWTFVAMLLLRNEGHFRTIRTQVSQPASGGNVTDMSEL